MPEKKGLGVGEVLEGVYEELVKTSGAREVDFPRAVHTIIADDSDYHRTRRGFMMYEKVLFLPKGEDLWVVAWGRARGGYPADPYDSVITAFVFEKRPEEDELLTHTEKALEIAAFFSHSLIVGMKSGDLAFIEKPRSYVYTQTNHLAVALGRALEARIQSHHVVTEKDVNRELIDMGTLRPLVTRATRYSPSIIPVIADAIHTVLSDESLPRVGALVLPVFEW